MIGLLRLILRTPGGRSGRGDGHRETHADKEVLFGWVHQPCDDAYYRSIPVEQGTSRIARVHRGIDLNEILQLVIAAHRREGTPEPGDDTRAHRAVQPERIAHGKSLVPHALRLRIAKRGRHN